MESDAPQAVARRLHPSTLLFSFGKAFRRLVIPGALALYSGRGSIWEAVFLVLFAFTAAHAVFRYFTLTWKLDATELIVKEGLLWERERHVPYARIQNVDLVQNLFHRMFGVAEVRLETASGSTPEAVLTVLGLEDVERIRTHVATMQRAHVGADKTDQTDDVGEPGAEDVLVRVRPRHLAALGLILNRGLAVVGAGFGLLYEADVLERLFGALGLGGWFDSIADAGVVGAVLQIAVLVAVGLLVLLGLSVAWSLMRFWGFALVAAGDDLRLSCGLLTRVSASIPRARIQALTIKETWLHRWFGLASIEAQTAGGAGSDADTSNLMRRRFVPILPAVDVPDVVRRTAPWSQLDDLDWQPLSSTAARRLRRRGLIVVALVAVPAVYFTAFALLAIVPAALGVWWYGGAAARCARFARTPWGLVWQRGILTRETTLLPGDKVQIVRVTHSPFDRRYDHVALVVDVAGGGIKSAEIRIRYLDRPVAEALHASLFRAAATTEYGIRQPAVA